MVILSWLSSHYKIFSSAHYLLPSSTMAPTIIGAPKFISVSQLDHLVTLVRINEQRRSGHHSNFSEKISATRRSMVISVFNIKLASRQFYHIYHSMKFFITYQQLDEPTIRAFYIQPTISSPPSPHSRSERFSRCEVV